MRACSCAHTCMYMAVCVGDCVIVFVWVHGIGNQPCILQRISSVNLIKTLEHARALLLVD